MSKVVHERVIVMTNEDSRECPSQEVGEVVRDEYYNLGIDENRGSGQLPTQHILHYRPFFNRVAGLRRHQNKSFRERRDSNSFDSHDCELSRTCCDCCYNHNILTQWSPSPALFPADDDECVMLRDTMPCRGFKKLHHHKPNQPFSLAKAGMVVETGEAGELCNTFQVCRQNKRKTPSPAMGVEPAPVSDTLLCDDIMDTEETLETEERIDTKKGTSYESDDNTLPPLSRRVSLSPVSRRLALQFDSISFFTPVKPSRSKRRKTVDTTLHC